MIKLIAHVLITYFATAFIVCNVKVFALTMSSDFTQEVQLPKKYQNEISDFWKKGHFSSFQGVANKRINYAMFIEANNNKCLVIVPGRSESYLKYQELVFDLFHQSFNIFIIDHRGQGLSERLTVNGHKGYVDSFDDYAEDLHTFIKQQVVNNCHEVNSNSLEKPYILAHSMGGTIALRLMQLYPSIVKSAMLAAPMIAINSGKSPDLLARGLVKTGSYLNKIFSEKPWYFPGQKDYQATLFKNNELTHSVIRYQNFIDIYRENPNLQLGGVTYHWLNQALNAQNLIFDEIDKLTTPIDILQASEDTIVDNHIQNEFCELLKKHQPLSCPSTIPTIINGAKHELFAEQDKYRNQALTQALEWFAKHP